MNLPGHCSPDASFEVPLEMLSACHSRIEQQCATLQRLAPHVAQHGADAQAQAAAAAVLRYFDTAAPLHHADEEIDLFPALIESMAGSDPVCIRQLTQGLADAHREIEAHWRRVRPALEQIAAGAGAAPDAAEVEGFTAAYQRHIDTEEAELLPMAGRLLSDDALDRVGRAMRERRGISSVD